MNKIGLTFAATCLELRGAGTLWWPDAGLLCVSDLHLGKSERMARRGGPLLPPFEGRETLARLEAEVDALAPRTVICLGDSFDDVDAAHALPDTDRATLTRLMAGREWVWIAGNHDPGPVDLGGTHMAEISLGGLVFRHVAQACAAPGEVSGHYHPKAVLQARGRVVRRAAFVHDDRRLILPAFGTFTGGLDLRDAAFRSVLSADARAILTGPTMVTLPVAGLRG